jgi:O-antigen/teichoic acid export membrane protein
MPEIHSLSIVKKLATDTAAYGVSSILARLINFLFGFLIIRYISPAEFGTYTNFYAYAGFLLVVLTHGMETAFFRFVNQEASKEKAFSTAFFSILSAVVIFVLIAYTFQNPIAAYVKEPVFYLKLFIWMMAFDVLAAIPFASLRAQGKPMYFAAMKVFNIILFIAFNIIFFIVLPSLGYELPYSKVSYIFIANLGASAITFLLLAGQYRSLDRDIDKGLYKNMLQYALPIMLVGFAGMINEVLDRIIMTRLLPYDDITNKEQLGIYGFNYKFAMIVTLFLQAYRYAAEPIFFRHAQRSNSKTIYADTMKYYTICVCVLFLSITLLMPLIREVFIWYSPNSSAYFVGAGIVPILLLANIFLGIYFNISTWYKVTDKTYIGAIIAVVGALITLVLNMVLVPQYGYWGAAWATLACYTSMVVIGYITEQKYYPIPYDIKRIGFYLALAIGMYLIMKELVWPQALGLWFNTGIAIFLIGIFTAIAWLAERKKSGGNTETVR